MKFIIRGSLVATSVGGIAFAGYKLNQSPEKVKQDTLKDYVQDKGVSWEYFLRGDTTDVCEKYHPSVKEIDRSCSHSWAKMIRKQEEKIGLWVYGNRDDVDKLLKEKWAENKSIVTDSVYKKWNSEKGIESLEKLGKDKCEIIEKPYSKVLVVCK